MLTGRTFTIVILCHHDAADAFCLVSLGSGRNLDISTIQLVLHLIALTVKGINGTH
jgi:hypothetical protein